MALLDQFFGSPDQTQALGLLGAGLMAGNPAAGFGAANSLLGSAPDRNLHRQLLTEELAMRRLAEQRAQAMFKAQMDDYNGVGGGSFGGPQGAAPAYSGPTSPGAFSPSADGMGPVAPTSILPTPPDPGQIKAAQLEALRRKAALGLPGAKEQFEMWKYANTPQNAPGGSFSVNPIDGSKTYNPKFDNGMVPDGQGGSGMIPGYGEAQARAAGLTADAQEQAKARLDLVKVVGPDGAERYVPRSLVAGQTQPTPALQPARPGPVSSRPQFDPSGDSDRFALLNQELQKAMASGNAGDIAAVQAEIKRLPASAKTGANPSGLAVPGFQASQTTAQKTSAKFGEDMSGKVAERLDKSATQAQTASDNLLGIQEARKALQGGAFMGSGAELKLGLTKFINANVPGITISPDKAANTDYLKSQLGQGLLEQAKTLGSNPSNADANRINDIVGSIGKDPNAMAKILDWRQEMATRAINQHNSRVDQAETTGYKAPFDLRVKNPLESGKTIMRTGLYGGKKVIQYSDGTTEYAN